LLPLDALLLLPPLFAAVFASSLTSVSVVSVTEPFFSCSPGFCLSTLGTESVLLSAANLFCAAVLALVSDKGCLRLNINAPKNRSVVKAIRKVFFFLDNGHLSFGFNIC
jgi:hypothetical protein